MRELRIASPEELRARVRPSVLGTWAALYRMDPWGGERADLRAGIVASTVANGLMKRKGGGQFRPVDFMPYHEPPAVDADTLFDNISQGLLGSGRSNKAEKKAKQRRGSGR